MKEAASSCGTLPHLLIRHDYSIKSKNMQATLTHFKTMLGPYGLYQHATKQVPNLSEGYCTDDNTRAVQLLLQWKTVANPTQQEQLELLLRPCWQFLVNARRPDGTWYNFRSAKGKWLLNQISDDMYARLARTAATVIKIDSNISRKNEATEMLNSLAPLLQKLTALRGWAETNTALSLLPDKHAVQFDVERLINTNTQRLLAAWQAESTPSWPWFESLMTYANAMIPQGLLVSRTYTPSNLLDEALHQSTDFLIKATIRDALFIPIGSVGWYPKGGKPSIENQQPIEAGTMFEFLLAYNAAFPGRLSADVILAPYLWFFGANTKQQVMANTEIGAAYDGLFLHGPNLNYGAESMLAYLSSEYYLSTAPQNIQSAAETARNLLM